MQLLAADQVSAPQCECYIAIRTAPCFTYDTLAALTSPTRGFRKTCHAQAKLHPFGGAFVWDAAWPSPNLPKLSLSAFCKAVHEIKGSDLQWVSLGDLCTHMELRYNNALNDALEYAKKEELLSCSPPPIHSVMLTHKGEMAARGRAKR
jgi:hypothetical protein